MKSDSVAPAALDSDVDYFARLQRYEHTANW